jgi:hypothetical protein
MEQGAEQWRRQITGRAQQRSSAPWVSFVFARQEYCDTVTQQGGAAWQACYATSIWGTNFTFFAKKNHATHERLIHIHHAVPLPYRAAKGLDSVFPIWFTQCGRIWFTPAMPSAFRSESGFSRPRHSEAWAWYGTCELASAAHRRHMGDLPAFGFFRLPRGVPRRVIRSVPNS